MLISITHQSNTMPVVRENGQIIGFTAGSSLTAQFAAELKHSAVYNLFFYDINPHYSQYIFHILK